MQAISTWRQPHNVAETNSRLATLNYYSSYLVALKLLALPLAQMVKSNVFEWNQSCAEAWNNIKFLMSLAIKNYTLDPTKPLLISTDASKLAASYCAWQVDDKGLWNPIKVTTRIFSKSYLNKAIVIKELIAMLFEVSSLESIIRSSTKKVVLFTDSLPLSFLHRNKNYGSLFHEAAIFLSSFPNLEILFISGKIPAFSDILTRQFQEVYMNTDSPLSQQWLQVPPPLSKLDGLCLNHEDLCAFLLKEPSQEPTFDVWAQSVKYRQRVHLTYLNHMLSVVPTDLEFYIGLESLHQQWNNPDLMTIPKWAELAQTNKLSDAKKTHIQ